jgi:hypothetical protein
MKTLALLILSGLFVGLSVINAQTKIPVNTTPRVEVFYFHPSERCPIDQSIEETTRKLMQTDFAKEIKEGTIKFQVFNTEDKASAKTVANFDINAQALYIVKLDKGKEIKNDLTEFAFSNAKVNPLKFKYRLKDEIVKALQ